MTSACATCPDDAHHMRAFSIIAILRILVAFIGAVLLWFELDIFWRGWPAIGLICLAFAVWPVLVEALHNLMQRRMTMELSMLIAILAAASIGEYFTALVVTLFVLLAEELEHMTLDRGRQALRHLMDFIPQQARVRRGDDVRVVPLADVVLGDHVHVSPGEKLPVDGTVMEGHSAVDQSRLTGESLPVEVRENSFVYAGSINQLGALVVRAEKLGRDTSYGQILEAVEAAESQRAPVQRLADKLAGYLVYFAFGAALLTFLITRDLRDTISVIIVTGACGIAAGTPLAVLGGIGRAAHQGSIIKGGVHLESLATVDTLVFDKTGTLTLGQPRVSAVQLQDGVDEALFLHLAASAEMSSEHPLAQAVVNHAQHLGLKPLPPQSFAYALGRGITATVETRRVLLGNQRLLREESISVPALSTAEGSELLMAVDGQYWGRLQVTDPLRPEAAAALHRLHGMGYKTVLLTGDVESVAVPLAKTLGIDDVKAQLLPTDKLHHIQTLRRSGHRVAMIGDGVNDAPALSAANLGIAMGSGTDIAKESADVVLIGNDLHKLVETLLIARQTRGVIWQNFAGTLGVDAIGIGLAAFGFLNPLLAAFIHVGSEMAFLLNSARLLKK